MRRTFTWLLFALLLAASALAQSSSTATIRGKVTNEKGTTLGGAEINAVGTASGFVKTVKAEPDGAFVLPGLTPAEYNIVVAAPGYEPRSETVRVLVGQNLVVNFVLTPTAVVNESITVVGNQLVDTRTPEVATNVTPQQMENLPQDDRNFLKFATLAPGIRLSTDPLRKTIAGDAQAAEQTNVFIDGVSFKNDVLQGGVLGQDSTRGNPFPQNAVQEFRVITQNYSAQYEKASSAIITAVTKSGGNEMQGQAFVFYQPKGWVAPTPSNFQFETVTTKQSYHRYQPGGNVGGPIIKDKLHYFVSYEGDQEASTSVVSTPNNTTGNLLAPAFSQYLGAFPSPFRENLAFGKLSWQPIANQLVDWSGMYRKEYDIRDFGGTTSAQAASKVNNWVYDSTLRHQWTGNSSLNQASLTWQKYSWNPTALNPGLIGQDYQNGGLRIGGKDTTQQFDQRRIELRDDYNFAPMKLGAGDHEFQVGGNTDFMHYRVNKSLTGNPIFRYNVADPKYFPNLANFNPADPNNVPYSAAYGFGNPIFSSGNNEYGIYGQDTWTVNPRLQLNLGLRWDYETNMLDNHYVTPANIVAGLTGIVDPSYFATGNNRKPYRNEYQPRFGFSYDLRGDSKSVLFGGAGRYYDRLYLNVATEERFHLQFPTFTFAFVPPGTTPTGNQIVWDPKYLSVAGLNGLIASGAVRPDVFLLSNNTRPPYSNQANLGFRQGLGTWVGSLSYNVVRGYHGPTWVSASGTCCTAPIAGFGNIIISDPAGGRRTWYNAWQLSLDKPYAGNWGAHLAYTHAKSEENGGPDLFAFDLPNTALYARHPTAGSEPNHLVAAGTYGLPFGTRIGATLTLGTGPATQVFDLSQGFDLAGHLKTGVLNRAVYPPKTWGFGYRDLDLRLEQPVPIAGRTSLSVIGEVFNAGNWANYGCLSNFVGPNDNPSVVLGNPGCVSSLGRREQLGLRVNF
jgi:hypothetical protein